LSFENLQQTYGIPTDERSFIDLRQNRTDFDSLIKKPFSGFEDLSLKLSHTDYQHTENQQDGTPDTRFKNKTTEARLSMRHLAIAGWQGSIGLQAQRENFSALAVATGRSDTIPATSSDAYALFAVEENKWVTGCTASVPVSKMSAVILCSNPRCLPAVSVCGLLLQEPCGNSHRAMLPA
jgi:iron complex outermembrane receptor protein